MCYAAIGRQVNIAIMRAFVMLRQMLASNAELAQKLETLEKRYDHQFKVVFDAIRELMTPIEPKRKQIGFTSTTKKNEKSADPSRVGGFCFCWVEWCLRAVNGKS